MPSASIDAAPASPRYNRAMTEPKLFLRLDLTSSVRLGPGKIRLLEAIEREGSISAAGRALKMSYRRAWLLIDELNSSFRKPLVATQLGGTGGGKASVTALGHLVVRTYRAMEKDASRMASRHSAPLLPQIRKGRQPEPRRNQSR